MREGQDDRDNQGGDEASDEIKGIRRRMRSRTNAVDVQIRRRVKVTVGLKGVVHPEMTRRMPPSWA